MLCSQLTYRRLGRKHVAATNGTPQPIHTMEYTSLSHELALTMDPSEIQTTSMLAPTRNMFIPVLK